LCVYYTSDTYTAVQFALRQESRTKCVKMSFLSQNAMKPRIWEMWWK